MPGWGEAGVRIGAHVLLSSTACQISAFEWCVDPRPGSRVRVRVGSPPHPPPRRQAARGCKADRLQAPSVRAGAVCVQRLGLVLGLGHAEGFVRRVQGVRRSWPSERYIGAQRRSSLEQKSWVEILVIRQRAGCKVQGASGGWRREARAEGGGAHPCTRRCDLTLTPTPTLNDNPGPNQGRTRARVVANRERVESADHGTSEGGEPRACQVRVRVRA